MHEDSELRRSSQYSQLAFGVFLLRWLGGRAAPGYGLGRSWASQGSGLPRATG